MQHLVVPQDTNRLSIIQSINMKIKKQISDVRGKPLCSFRKGFKKSRPNCVEMGVACEVREHNFGPST